ATTRGMHLSPPADVALTHCVLLALSVSATTFAHTDTPHRPMGKAALVVRELEIRRWIPWVIVRPQTQVFVDAIGFNDLSRIHVPVWIPNRLEFAKRLDQLRPKHFV